MFKTTDSTSQKTQCITKQMFKTTVSTSQKTQCITNQMFKTTDSTSQKTQRVTIIYKLVLVIETIAVFCDKNGYHVNTLHTDLNLHTGGIYTNLYASKVATIRQSL